MTDVAATSLATSFTAIDPMAEELAAWRAAVSIDSAADASAGPGRVLLAPLKSEHDLRAMLIADGRTLCAAGVDPRHAPLVGQLARRRGALFSLCITTRAAMEMDVSHAIRRAVEGAGRIGRVAADDFETCLHEAASNALIHGNLGVGSHLRETVEASIRFSAVIDERLADPDYAARLLFVRVAAVGPALIVSIGDQGGGMPHGAPVRTLEQTRGRAVGRGLGLIRSLTHDMRHRDGGRICVMRVTRAP